jgi:hypothetical protein
MRPIDRLRTTLLSERQRTAATGDSSRRGFLRSGAAALAAALLPPPRRARAAPPAPSSRVEQEDAPRASEAYAQGDVRGYGIVPNSNAAASANTRALKALVDPAGSFTGTLYFPNTTGSDVYYFNDLIAFHDGVQLDLKGCALNFTKTGDKRDSASGFIHAIRDFTIANGALVTSYVANGGYNTGNAMAFGGRGMDSALFPNLYDRLLPAPMGNITVRNLRIMAAASDNAARGIFMLGGFDGVAIDNVWIEGQGRLAGGIYYEFGWATNEPKETDRQSSHARNIRITNLTVTNVINEAFGAQGGYDILIDGLRMSNCGHGCLIGTGEALYFRPWVPGSERNRRASFAVRNVLGEAIRNVGLWVTGASKLSGSYLDNPPAHDNPYGLSADQQTDLIDFSAEQFSLSGTGKNFGILSSAATTQIGNGTLVGFNRGIVTTQECTRFDIESVKILDSASFGIQIGQNVSIHAPPRPAAGVIRDCLIAGSGTAGKSAGLFIGTTQSCLIENCRLGYDLSTDGKSESTQTQAVSIAADAAGVTCRNNYVAATADGAVAYVLAGAVRRNCRIENARGIKTATGPWQ